MPFSKAAASANGFHDDPGWRPEPPPTTGFSWDQHVASTLTVTFLLVGLPGQPPRAMLTLPYWVPSKFAPPTSALTYPVPGSTATSPMPIGFGWPFSSFSGGIFPTAAETVASAF